MAEAAAHLLYRGEFKEFIEAKRAAAESLGADLMPSNLEVARKLLEHALEVEGEGYWERLRRLRAEALELMEALRELKPRLVGSAWRGVLKPHSDVDVEVDCEEPEMVEAALRRAGYPVVASEPINVPEPLRMGSLWRVRTRLPSGVSAEVILKEHEAYLNPPTCDIYGDLRKGLSIGELKEVLERRPRALFIPGEARA